MIKKIRTIGLFLALVFTPVLSQAAVVSLGFTDTLGQAKEVAPATRYLNPTSPMQVAVSAGLNRKIRLLLVSGGVEIDNQLSGVIGSESTFIRDGVTHFGHVFELPAGLAEGEYTLIASTLDSQNQELGSEQHTLTLDVTPPTTGVFSWTGNTDWTDPTGWMLSPAYTEQVMLSDVTDGGSGLANSVRVLSYWADGAEAGVQAGEVEGYVEGAVATTGVRTRKWGVLFPQHRRYYTLRFEVADRAGNLASPEQQVSYSSDCGEKPTLVAAHNPNQIAEYLGVPELAGFEDYTPGMVVYENPLSTLWRLPKSNDVSTTEFGIINFTAAHEDADYIYFQNTTAVRDTYPVHEMYRFRTYTRWECGYVQFDVQLDSSVQGSPTLTGALMEFDDGTTSDLMLGGITVMTKNAPFRVVGFTATLEPRTYTQTVRLISGGFPNPGQCEVAPGDTGCTFAYDFSPSPESGEIQFRIQARDPTLVLLGSTQQKLLRWDFAPPLFVGLSFDEPNQQALLEIHDPHTVADYRSQQWRPVAQELRFHSSTGDPQLGYGELLATLTPAAEDQADTNNFHYTFDLSQLPEGDYAVLGYVRDTFDNEREEVLASYLKDATGPVVSITKDGADLDNAQVAGMEGLLVALADAVDPAPRATGIFLSGGSIQGELALSWIDNGNGTLAPEPPMLFPNEPGTNYTLRVVAVDAYGNQTSQSAAFTYAPPTVTSEDGGPVFFLRSTEALIDAEGNWPLRSTPILDANGNPVAGAYTLQVVLDAGATGSIWVDGQLLAPGESAAIAGYDLSANADRIVLPLAVADPGVDVQGQLMVATGHPDLPVFVAELRSWSPADEITLTPPQPQFNTLQDAVVIEAVAASGGHCGGAVTSDVAAVGDFCAVRWDQLPGNLAADTWWNASTLSGGIAQPGDYELIYQPGVMQPGGFAAVGEPVLVPVTVSEPPPPVIGFASTGTLGAKQDWVPDGEWPAEIGENKLAGYVHVNGDSYGIAMRVVAPDSSEQVVETQADSLSKAVYTDLADLAARETYRIEAWYQDYPPAVASAEVTFTPVPKSPSVRLLRPGGLHNQAPVVIEGNLGDYVSSGQAYSFDPALHGDWQVRLRITDRQTGETFPIAGPVTISAADGAFSVDVGTLPKGYYEAVALGDRIATGHLAEAAIESARLYLYVDDASAVSANIYLTGGSTGPVPYYAKPAVRLQDLRRAQDLGEILWESSPDGAAFAPIESDRALAYGIVERLEEPQKRWYRATLVNRYSGQRFVTDAVEVQSYRKPKFSLAGYLVTFAGNPVTWNATLSTPDAVEFEWQVRDTPRGAPVVASGESFDFAADAVGYKYVTVVARPLDAANIDKAAATLTRTLKVLPPYLRPPSIRAPYYVETGQTYEFLAVHGPLITGNVETDLVRRGEWMLPDGTVIPEDVVNYTIQPGDTKLTYRAWVDGYEAETEIVIDRTFRTWTYQWPDTWSLKASLAKAFAPTNVTAMVFTDPVTDMQGMGGLKPEYQFNLPPGMDLLSQYGNRAVLSIAEPGEYPIEAVIRDDRGNEALVYQVVSIPEPPPLEVGLQLFPGDAWNRVPAKITARMTINNPVLGESMSTHRLYLDGALAYEGRYTVIAIEEIAVAGPHTVRSEVEMDTGRNAAAEAMVEFVEGVPPDCHLEVVRGDGVSSLEIQTYCTLEQGRIERYRWRYTYQDTGDEVQLGYSGSRISFTSSTLVRGVASVTVAVENDKGQVTEASLVP